MLAGRDPAAQPLLERLTRAYWTGAEAILADAASRGGLAALDAAQRAWLDEGVPGASAPVLPDPVEGAGGWRVYTVSEWLAQEVEETEAIDETHRVAREALGGQEAEAHAARLAAHYAVLRPLLAQIPGVTHPALEALASGKLDRHLAALRAAGQDRTVEAQRLAGVRAKLLSEARRRATSERERWHLAAIALLEQEAPVAGPGAAVTSGGAPSPDGRSGRFRREARALEARLRLGISDEGFAHAFPWRVRWPHGLDKPRVRATLSRIQEGDPNFPVRPDVVLLPFVGSGFYEWDHNFLGLPLRPTADPEIVILRAVASFRLLDDAVNKRHQIVERYRTHVAGTPVREAFLRDYAAWITEASQGLPLTMDAWALDFFLEQFGPSPERLLLPAAWVGLSREESDFHRRKAQARAHALGATARDQFEFGALCLQSGMFRNAADAFLSALPSDPESPRLLFAAGYALRRAGDAGEGLRLLERAAAAGGPGLWSAYARRAVQGSI